MTALIGLVFVGALFYFAYWTSKKPKPMKLAPGAVAVDLAPTAPPESKIVCQFCHEPGSVSTRMYKKKGTISGGKATSAILTGGVSLLATGLARKGWVTQLKCSNCGMTWEVAA